MLHALTIRWGVLVYFTHPGLVKRITQAMINRFGGWGHWLPVLRLINIAEHFARKELWTSTT